MSETYYVNQPAPGASSEEGAYMQNPQEPSYYFQDANQYGMGTVDTTAVTSPSVSTPQTTTDASSVSSWVAVTDPTYLKGVLVGVGVGLVVTNPKVQKAVVSGAVRFWAAIQGGVEEIKEQIQDVKAELSREE